MRPLRIALHNGNGARQQVAPDFYAKKLVSPLSQSRVKALGEGIIGGIIYPVPAFHKAHSLCGGAELGFVFSAVIHKITPGNYNIGRAKRKALQKERFSENVVGLKRKLMRLSSRPSSL